MLRVGATGLLSDSQLERIAKLQGATIVLSPALSSLHACISQTAKGMIIRVNPRLSPPERRFAIAHEIVHTLIDGDIPFPRQKLTEKIERPLRASHYQREYICDLVASEILAPRPISSLACSSIGNGTGALEQLGRELGLPLEGMLIHLAGHRPQLKFTWL